MTAREPRGSVAFVGAGPGDPGLLTARGRDLLAVADVVVIGGLVNDALVQLCRRDAEIVHAAKSAAGPGLSRAEVDELIVDRARDLKHVVELVAGDPFLLGSAAEAAEACRKAHIPWQLVPGVSAAVAAPAYAGIPVTHRAVARGVTIVDAHRESSAEPPHDWATMAAGTETLVLVNAVARLGKIAATLVEHGRGGDTPAAVIEWVSGARQRTLVSTLDTVERDVAAAKPARSAIVVVGAAVRLRSRLNWWESRPLFGATVLVARAREQAASLSDRLRDLGATPIEVPTIAIEPPRNPAALEKAVHALVSGRYAWVAFTSVNAVDAVFNCLDAVGLDARVFAGVRIAAVGETTEAMLRERGLRADLLPAAEATAAQLVADWPQRDLELDFLDRVLLPRADIAPERMVGELRAKGWLVDDVTAYRTVRAQPPTAEVREQLRNGGIDVVCLTSASTVRNLLALAGRPAESTVIAAIGPATARTARELGLRVDVQARASTVDGLVDAVSTFITRRRRDALRGVAEAPGETHSQPAKKRAPAARSAPATPAKPAKSSTASMKRPTPTATKVAKTAPKPAVKKPAKPPVKTPAKPASKKPATAVARKVAATPSRRAKPAATPTRRAMPTAKPTAKPARRAAGRAGR